jgi:MFS superfamily sulfate permease-like transporter
LTAAVVCAIGVEQGIIVAIILSILDIVRRQYKPKSFVVGVADGTSTYQQAGPGVQSAPGLIVLRYDAELFFANSSRFVDDVEKLINSAPDRVRWLVMDAGPIDDIDYSAGVSLGGLLDFLDSRQITFAIADADAGLIDTLDSYDLLRRIGRDRIYGRLADARAAFEATAGADHPAGTGRAHPGPTLRPGRS